VVKPIVHPVRIGAFAVDSAPVVLGTCSELLEVVGRIHPTGTTDVSTLAHGLLDGLDKDDLVLVGPRAATRALINASHEFTGHVSVPADTLLKPDIGVA
jgi:hypothetical protein